MMRPFKSLIPLESALEIIMDTIKPITRTEEVSISDANGRVLAEDITANIDVPPFDRAAMDGYAVRAEDTYGAGQFNPVALTLIDVVHAGEVSKKKVGAKECIQVATGCEMPTGADAVVMVEHAEQCDDKVKIFKPVHPRENVSGKGDDISVGSKVLSTGEYLNPSKVGVLAALGIQKVRVYEKSKVAIIPTGREIVNIGCELKDAQVYDINSYTLSAIMRENGCTPVKFDIVLDTYEAVRVAMINALKYDVVVFSGGSSVGESDILCDVVRELGDVLFHGVQIKPGKPTLFGVVRGKPVFGIPGYPTSCLSNGYRFLLPAARQLARLPKKNDIVVRARLAQRVVSTLGRSQFLTVRLEDGVAHPVFKESGAITSMADADGYVDIPVNVDLLEKDEEVDVILL